MSVQTIGCICDGGFYRPEQIHPFLVHPDCPVHGYCTCVNPEDDRPCPMHCICSPVFDPRCPQHGGGEVPV